MPFEEMNTCYHTHACFNKYTQNKKLLSIYFLLILSKDFTYNV